MGIIVASARTAIAERIEGYRVGADVYLPKPVSPAELLSAVEVLGTRVLSMRALTRSVPVDDLTLDSVRLTLRGPAAEVDVTDGENVLLEFVSQVDGIHINGIDLIRLDEKGMIKDFKVMVRPLKAINKLWELMAAQELPLAAWGPDAQHRWVRIEPVAVTGRRIIRTVAA